MSWRFRKSFKVLPGVKLNLTARGLSTTIGASPFSINIGPTGVYRNVGIPGTGIWDRQRIDIPTHPSLSPPSTDQNGSPVPFIPSSPVPGTATEIHSASTEALGSDSLEHLRALLTETYGERGVLTNEVAGATLESNTATNRYERWNRGFLFKKIWKQSFAARKEAAETATAKLEELQEQLRLTTLATEITVDKEQAEPYYRMRDEFAALTGCQTIWNVLTEQSIDRVAQRTTANTIVSRKPVGFSLDSCDLIEWEKTIPHLRNLTGGDMYVYPGFILYRASKQAFALIDFRDVTLSYVSTSFTESETVPSDSQVIGQTWAKSNKDGSPDRRFSGNYQIPVAHYGGLVFKSPDGLDVRYLCSNAQLAERFVKSWAAFRQSFIGEVQQPTGNDGADNKLLKLQKGKQASERLGTALPIFVGFFSKFVDTISAAAQEDGHGTTACKVSFSTEEFAAYMTSVTELIEAAKDLEANSFFVSRTARGKFQRAIQSLETTFTTFWSEEQVNNDGVMPFVNAASAFLSANQEFSTAIEKTANKAASKVNR